MFASKTVPLHLLRGVGGFTAFGLALFTAPWGWPPFLLLPLGLVLLRGCPMCWLVGLFETIGLRTQMACEVRFDKPRSPPGDAGR